MNTGGRVKPFPIPYELPGTLQLSASTTPAPNRAPERKKHVVILGGGVGAMTAAFTLTNHPGWDQFIDITVYQLGWRLGGKGASGRNGAKGNRIEEHGIHVWLGCYQNAFAMMRQCYAELGRPPNVPLAQWTDAFQPWPDVGVMEQIGTGNGIHWVPWIEHFAVNDQIPGNNQAPSLWNMAGELIELMLYVFSTTPTNPVTWSRAALLPSALKTAFEFAGQALFWAGTTVGPFLEYEGMSVARFAARAALGKARELHGRGLDHQSEVLGLVEKAVGWFKNCASAEIATNTPLRRTFIFLDFATSMLRGAVHENVFTKGLDVLDKYDLREFLKRYGAHEVTYDSALVGGTYDFPFADRVPGSNGSLAAGAIIRGMWITMFGYSGSMFYKMMAGMGDVVFAPLYEVLKRRGVTFKFFHKVTAIKTNATASTPGEPYVDEICLREQIKTLHGREYEPLQEVEGLSCWPNEPRFDLLEGGGKLEEGLRHPKEQNYNLESYWNNWPDAGQVTLARGVDFDEVVLGISLGALKELCPTLIAADSRWKKMIDNVPHISTFGVQLWLNPTSPRLGRPIQVIVDNFAEPLNTWADMSHLLPRESWGHADGPGSIAYFCGVLDDPGIPDQADYAFPERVEKEVKDMAGAWLSRNARILWGPDATTGACPEGLNRWLLFADNPAADRRQRYEWQFFRANVDPSERYVNTPAGSIESRIGSDDSGFANLVLAGDWTKNHFNLGCVEAAALSGMTAAQGIFRHVGAPIFVLIVNEADKVV
jgi:uncharacterized protein with NAD-binding domain and iron-sulfur cluster